MARVMLDECLEKVGGNRFDLVLIAAKRAHQLSSGSHKAALKVEKDRPSVVALREVEKGMIGKEILQLDYDFELPQESKTKEQLAKSKLQHAEITRELSQHIVEDGELSEVEQR